MLAWPAREQAVAVRFWLRLQSLCTYSSDAAETEEHEQEHEKDLQWKKGELNPAWNPSGEEQQGNVEDEKATGKQDEHLPLARGRVAGDVLRNYACVDGLGHGYDCERQDEKSNRCGKGYLPTC
jgi:hypothetical protein